MFKWIKALEINTSFLFNNNFANNTIWSWFFFFLIIDLHFLISAVIAQIFNPIAELVIPTKEEILDMETHPAIAEPTIRKCSI